MTASLPRLSAFPLLALLTAAPAHAGAEVIPAPLADAVVRQASADRTLTRALTLLPKRPGQVVIIDVSRLAPALEESTRHLDAFVTEGSRVIYLTSHSAVLKGALDGSRFHLYVLASIIWHEMAHLQGEGEADARRSEEQLWRRFVRDGLLDQVTALRYLELLLQRDSPHMRLTGGR
jgi:hypothetical protein